MPLLETFGLSKQFRKGSFRTRRQTIHAVTDVSLSLEAGQTIGLVGESGCGKTTLARLLLNLVPPTSGRIVFEGRDITNPPRSVRRWLRRHMQVVFQDPSSSLDPRQRIGDIIREPLDIHQVGTPGQRHQRVAEVMDQVALASRYVDYRPHELSGGLRQRVGIATALVLGPSLIVADEPVSALDVSVQAQILNLLADLQKETGVAYVFVSHDLGVVRHISDQIAVMYLGRIVESGPIEQVYAQPQHPYTEALLSAIPPTDPDVSFTPIELTGEVTTPLEPPPGCGFAQRCRLAEQVCAERQPELLAYDPDHHAACHVTARRLRGESQAVLPTSDPMDGVRP